MTNWTESKIKAIDDTKLHRVDKCLYIQANKSGRRRWVYRYRSRVDGKLKQFDLGEFGKARDGKLSIAEARKQARTYRLVADPKHEFEVALEALREQQSGTKAVPTFAECRKQYIDIRQADWKNAKHQAQWTSTLRTYVEPVFGDVAVNEVTAEHVLAALQPHWHEKTETMTRVRCRIGKILDWAASPTRRYRSGPNPAAWEGNLEHELASPTKLKRKRFRHHPALPYSQMHEFMTELRTVDSTSARALEFLVLTAARTNEVRMMEWSEVDLDRQLWVVPSHRMKTERPHRVPLSDAAIAVLEGQLGQHDKLVFPGARHNRPLSNMAMLEQLRGMREAVTVHGFRASFKTWTAEKTPFPRLVVEAALSHTIRNEVEAAYMAGGDHDGETDFLERRVEVMDRWAQFIDTPPAAENVTELKATA